MDNALFKRLVEALERLAPPPPKLIQTVEAEPVITMPELAPHGGGVRTRRRAG